MNKSFWPDRRANLIRRGTHMCQFGNIYRKLGDQWWKFVELEYINDLKYPCYIRCDEIDADSLNLRDVDLL